MKSKIDKFFDRYVDAYNKAIQGSVDTSLIRNFFSKKFFVVGPNSVKMRRNSVLFSLILNRAYAFYRKIGTKQLSVVKIDRFEIDINHSIVKVFYRADYEKKSAEKISINFDVTYLLEHCGDEMKIFGFIAGDEMKVYRDADLV